MNLPPHRSPSHPLPLLLRACVRACEQVLCASNADHTQVDPLRPPAGVPIGEKLTFEGFTGEPIDVINPKKKLLEKLFPDLKTDADGVAKYKNAAFTTSKGTCTASLKDALVR